MDIYQAWKVYKKKIQDEQAIFNEGKKYNDIPKMLNAKQSAKRIYLQFIQLLKLQNSSDQSAFQQILKQFADDIRMMSQTLKKMQGKNVIKDGHKDQKKEIQNSLEQIIVKEKPNVKWSDVAGLQYAKNALKQTVIMPIKFPKMFTGSRKPWKGILLYGPPGTGKTFIAKACANQIQDCVFYSVSTADIMSKYVGESEKIVKLLFEGARKQKSCVIFIDEVDSLAGNRSQGDNQSSRRVKTQFLVQMDGVGNQGNKPLVLGATNLPWELDPAIRRRFQRRIYIPLPQLQARFYLLKKLCAETPNCVRQNQFRELAERTQGYSGSDIATLIKDAVYQPLRISQKARKFKMTKNQKGQPAWIAVPPSQNLPNCKYFQGKLNDLQGKLVLPNLQYKHFVASLMKVKPSVDESQLAKYLQFTQKFGMQQ